MQNFLTKTIPKKPMPIEKARHGNAPTASWWRDEGGVAFLDGIDGNCFNKDKAAAWFHDYPEEQCMPSMGPSETRMLDVPGAIHQDQIHNSEAIEVIQATNDANIACKKVEAKRRMQLRCFSPSSTAMQSAHGSETIIMSCMLTDFHLQVSKAIYSGHQTGKRKRFWSGRSTGHATREA